MRSQALTMLFIAAALFGENTTVSAQSARLYPWCAIYYGIDATGTPSCSFDTRQQCMETISGIGGLCVENSVTPPPRAQLTKTQKRKSTH